MSDDPGQAHSAPATLLYAEHLGHPVNLVVPDGKRLIILVRGEAPIVVPLDQPGVYEVELEALLGGHAEDAWPVALIAIDLGHVAAWQALSAVQVGRMLDQLQLAKAMLRQHPAGRQAVDHPGAR